MVTGAARWDLVANQINQYVIGAGYVDDCFVLAANYVTSYSYAAGTSPPVLSHAFMLQIGLRTIAQSATTAGGGASSKTGVGTHRQTSPESQFESVDTANMIMTTTFCFSAFRLSCLGCAAALSS